MTEEIFWEHHKALPIDHYTLLERVSDPQGDITDSCEATRKIKVISAIELHLVPPDSRSIG